MTSAPPTFPAQRGLIDDDHQFERVVRVHQPPLASQAHPHPDLHVLLASVQASGEQCADVGLGLEQARQVEPGEVLTP